MNDPALVCGEICPGACVRNGLALRSDAVVFAAAREAGRNAMLASGSEKPEEAGVSLAKYRLGDILEGRLGDYSEGVHNEVVEAGVACASAHLTGRCALRCTEWFAANNAHDPDHWID